MTKGNCAQRPSPVLDSQHPKPRAEELMQLPPSASVDDEREIIARLHAESENVAERSSWGGAGTAAA